MRKHLLLALKLARKDSTVAFGLVPVAFYKSLGRVDFEEVKRLSLRKGEKKTLGFFLELTSSKQAAGVKKLALNLRSFQKK